jgi:hypothetical protein
MVTFLLGVYVVLRTYDLAPGERAYAFIFSSDRGSARVIFGYVLAFLEATPAFAALIERKTADTIDLTNGCTIQIATASFRTPRGYKIVFAGFDEVAFWRTDDSANPDTEVTRAVRPSLASVPEALLIAISSPYSQRGELWRNYERHYGRDGDVMVWQADTRTMNPTISQAVVDRALAEDPAAASAEWLGQFRSDLEALMPREALDTVVVPGRRELPPVTGIAYCAFVDPSGGSADSFTMAIAHRDAAGIPVLDLVREVRPPSALKPWCWSSAAI